MSIRFVFATLLSIVLCGAFVSTASATGGISTTLRFGDSGPQVLLLQQLLNKSPDTEVAASGIGSPGMESSYFGAKTLDAVKRYQNKYSAEILVPAGLATPSGIVGPLTLAMLQKGTSTSTTAAATTSSTPLQQYVAAVNQAGAQQGYSSTTLALITAKILATAASTTDFQAKFFKDQQTLYQTQASIELSKPFAQKVFDIIIASAKRLLMPDIAQAGVGLPFGGFVTYSNPLICDCPPGVTQIFVSLGAPTPTSNLLLDYVDGTEAFNWHTLPAPGVATLGIYEPGVQSCITYIGDACFPVPAVGTITPEAGSSVVP
ncbi:MAG TPA: peptidoglycan-binding domain-containing protein [Candidatus Paceibacterota bacterium]|nr:peptidoglycan-binding domain-containing protein [Candidatus Paceibacterota bacterium]